MAVPQRRSEADVLIAAARRAATTPPSMASSAQVFRKNRKPDPATDRTSIAKPWQIEAYRHVKICGEARYAAVLFSSIAGRAEIGVSEPQALVRKPVWVNEGPEVEALAELVPDVRARSKLLREYMLHRIIAGECYLIARERVPTDPGYEEPPEGWNSWDEYLRETIEVTDVLDPDYDPYDAEVSGNPNVENPIWEIVAVTEIQRTGDGNWEVRHENGNYIQLKGDDPVIRLWNPDPEQRLEAWSPFRSLLPTLREIEFLTRHIFTQVRSRLMSAGTWFLPNNLTFPDPPPDAVEGGAEAIAAMNEAERFMVSLAASGMTLLEDDEVAFPSVVMADPAGLDAIDQKKLIQFWSEIDDKAMTLRSAAVRRFALGMDLIPEDVVGASGMNVEGGGSSGGSVNHWGEWAKQEKTISLHVEPALDDFVGTLTEAYLRSAVENTEKVLAYDTATLRLRPDRSKEALELHQMGLLGGKVTIRENGFDPESDMMDDTEFKRWLLVKIAGGSATPEQVNESLRLLGVILNVSFEGQAPPGEPAPGQPGRNLPRSLDQHPRQGPPEVDHEHNDAPFSVTHAMCEGMVLRALEKAGNRLLNDGKRGRDKDRTTPPHLAHLSANLQKPADAADFDFSMAQIVLPDMSAKEITTVTRKLSAYCAKLYNSGDAYSREGLTEALGDL